MCRNIKCLTETINGAKQADFDAAALQYVRKVTGLRKPNKHMEQTYFKAVQLISEATELIVSELNSSDASLQMNLDPNP